MHTTQTNNPSTRKFSTAAAAAACVIAFASRLTSAKAATFADFFTIDSSADIATGQLNGIPFTLLSTRVVNSTAPSCGFYPDGGIVPGGDTNGTSTAFSNAYFTPPLATGDVAVLSGASDFRITFSGQVSNFTMHIGQLAGNKHSFTDGAGTPMHFSLVSGDGNLTVLGGGTSIMGVSGGNNASGSLLFQTSFTELKWASDSANNCDAVLLQFSVSPSPPLVINGGFESPLVPDNSHTVIPVGDTLAGWTVANNDLDLARSLWDPAESAQSISLNQVGPSTISQTIATTAGTPYQLSFFMAAEIFGGIPNRTMEVLWGGAVVGTPSFQYTGQGPNNMGWVQFTYTVVGTGNDTLAFRSTTPGNYGPALDGVTLVPLPYQLAIRKFDDTQATLTWSTNATGFVLEYGTSLPATAWFTATNAVEIVGDQFAVTLETTSSQQFFRLHKP